MIRRNGMVDCMVTTAVMLVWFVAAAGTILGTIAVDDALSNALGEQTASNELIKSIALTATSLLGAFASAQAALAVSNCLPDLFRHRNANQLAAQYGDYIINMVR